MSLFLCLRSSSSSSISRSAIRTSSSSLRASWKVIVLSSSVGLAACTNIGQRHRKQGASVGLDVKSLELCSYLAGCEYDSLNTTQGHHSRIVRMYTSATSQLPESVYVLCLYHASQSVLVVGDKARTVARRGKCCLVGKRLRNAESVSILPKPTIVNCLKIHPKLFLSIQIMPNYDHEMIPNQLVC